jgi:hypothetical protein
MPAELRHERLDDVTAQPLLNHLLALLRAEPDPQQRLQFGPDLNLNEVYAKLLEQVYQRVWGESANAGHPSTGN